MKKTHFQFFFIFSLEFLKDFKTDKSSPLINLAI